MAWHRQDGTLNTHVLDRRGRASHPHRYIGEDFHARTLDQARLDQCIRGMIRLKIASRVHILVLYPSSDRQDLEDAPDLAHESISISHFDDTLSHLPGRDLHWIVNLWWNGCLDQTWPPIPTHALDVA